MNQNRHDNEWRGRRSETWAAWFLRLKLYRILHQRYKTPVGEIDLIARRGNLLVFVEVKARNDLSEGLMAVTARQQQRISRAASSFLAKHQELRDLSIRFDVIVVQPRAIPHHMVDAWRVN